MCWLFVSVLALSGRFASSSPKRESLCISQAQQQLAVSRNCLSLWERWHRASDDGEGLSALLLSLIGQLAALDGGIDPAVELCTIKGAVMALGVQLFFVHGVGGCLLYTSDAADEL